nr:immunoglobulin light chain junction region [Mus musculus]NSL98130.1 immunoglobulin light chain junction region [Mus musculus]NSL99107.1 immunoglobulin light chain junction region [Mus musculus]NSL99470.1 immunoglobulin light chain junction region [Mus musculus]NSM00133.1 immunoglobulin light chain junction region [Mus musculus]
CLQYASSPWTF